MQGTPVNPDQNMLQTQNTFKALVNAIIPRSPDLAYEYGIVQYYGALDLQIDEYVILTLDSLNVPLAMPTAEMLNYAASQYISSVIGSVRTDYSVFNTENNFAALTPYHQLSIIEFLRQIQIDLNLLPVPFQNNPALVVSTMNLLVNTTMMGYYSEWAGYGSTRLNEPNQRKLEFYPISWKQVGYPGPSLGYHALRSYQFT